MNEQYSPEFELFWAAFPKRAGDNPKKPAFEKWKSATKRIRPDDLLTSAKLYHQAVFDKIGTVMVPMVQTWLHQRRWEQLSEPPAVEKRDIPPPNLSGWRLEAWKQLGDTIYEAWIAPATFTKRGDVVVAMYPTAFKANFARDRYGARIEALMRAYDHTVTALVCIHPGLIGRQ